MGVGEGGPAWRGRGQQQLSLSPPWGIYNGNQSPAPDFRQACDSESVTDLPKVTVSQGRTQASALSTENHHINF